jgi:hypothetical protein
MDSCQVSPHYSLLSKTTLRNISGFLINKSGFKLYQYLSIPFRFVCFTENDSGIRNEVELQPLPELDLPVNLADAPERGWHKLTVFKQGFGGLAIDIF